MSKIQFNSRLFESLFLVCAVVLLAGVVKPVLDDQARLHRDAERAESLQTVATALEAYHEVYGSYPETQGHWSGISPDNRDLIYIPELVPEFLDALPQDPIDGYPLGNAGFLYCSDGTDYKFMAHRTPESMPQDNPFADPVRPNVAWMVSTPGARNW